MSFGVGLGDVVLLCRLAWDVYITCKESSDDFRRLATEVASLHVVLKETEVYINEFTELDASRKNRLEILTNGCSSTLQDLEKLLKHYESLGTQAQRTWDRMRFGMEDLADVRSRIVSNVTMLTAFNSTLANSSTSRIEKRLNKFIAEVRAGFREGSVVTTPDVTENIESPDVWNQLRRELEDIGISASIMEENHEYISSWMRNAIRQGLDELSPEFLDSRRPSDSGYGGSVISQSAAAMNVANGEFEAELRQKQVEKPLDEIFRPTTNQSLTPSVRVRADPTRLIRKLFQKDTAIVQAASDGDLKKVADLISIGCNVNAKDRWGWTALSMAAYGGHLSIARLLLDHDADMDNIDVDGDTPMQLAATRGHSDIAILFDHVRAERDLRAREMDNEQPRRVVT
ncbi:multiple ankyrin repeats single KH domain (pfs domain-containing protein) [Seiridium cupressi]